MTTIDDETNNPCQISYEAGYRAGKNLALSGADLTHADEAVGREARHQEDPEGYRDGFWDGYHHNA